LIIRATLFAKDPGNVLGGTQGALQYFKLIPVKRNQRIKIKGVRVL